jgi:hypothetical protein
MHFCGKKARWTLAGLLAAVIGSGYVFTKDDSSRAALPISAPPAARRERHDLKSGPSQTARLKEIHRMLAAAQPIDAGELRNDEVIDLLRRLAEYDPAAAIEFTAQHPELHGKADLVDELFGGWLEQNEEYARDWLRGIPAGNLRVQVVPVLVAHLASEKPEEALALAGELPGYDGALDPLRPFGKWDHGDEIEGRVRERAYAEIFGEWAGSDPVAAAARATALEDPLLRNLAMQEVASKWFLQNSSAAVEWMKQLPAGTERNSALQGLMPEWTAQDPPAAASFLTALADGPERNEWLRLLGENWSSSDPQTVLAWAAKLPGEADRNLIVQSVLAKVAESGGQQAADFVLTLPAGTARTQGMELVLARWRADDAEAVKAWVEALPRESLREEARAVLPME